MAAEDDLQRKVAFLIRDLLGVDPGSLRHDGDGNLVGWKPLISIKDALIIAKAVIETIDLERSVEQDGDHL